MDITVHKATITDAEVACIVLRRSITECCVEDHRNDPETLSVWLQNKTPENIANWFAAPDSFPVIAISGKQIFGVGLLTGKGEVALCYVLPEVRFKGAGKSLLNAMESHALKQDLLKFASVVPPLQKPFICVMALYPAVRRKWSSEFRVSPSPSDLR